ncbi:uncharacterized protein V1518DRAFT_167002 [Limtongia smithiae]|uniref:uncharacterized protein n=1 Tax=Limtongia smithiae TaxID=1125753 RepID=UPI0034CD7E17
MSSTINSQKSMPFAKKYLLAAREAVDQKNYVLCRDQCLLALHENPNLVNGLILLAYSHSHLNEFQDAEATYKKAIELNPKSITAWQGLRDLYKQYMKISQYIDTVKQLLLQYRDLDDINHAISNINDMRKFILDKGSRADHLQMLKLQLPESPLFPFLDGRIPPPAETLERLTDLIQTEENERIQNTVKSQRNMLGANLSEITRRVKLQVYESSQLEHYYRELLNWSHSEEQRREVEGRLLSFLYNKLLALPMDKKSVIRQNILELSTGMIVVKSPIEQAWVFGLEWVDCADLSELDATLVREYIFRFPDKGLARVLIAFLKSDISPFQSSGEDEAEDSEITILSEQWDETEILVNFIEGYELRPDSLLANRILGMYYLHIAEYENAVEIALAGQALLKKVERDVGWAPPNYRIANAVTLGTAYIYYQAPRHFHEALAIFDSIIAINPKHAQALIGKALILEESGKINDARDLLATIVAKNASSVQAQLELAWCEVLLGNYESGREGLHKSLDLITKNDPASQMLRAKIWWRIGQSLWQGDKDNRADRSGAYTAFVTSLKCNQNFPQSYTSLGMFYADIEHDEERAGKCFHRAFELDATEEEAARRLAEAFANDQEWDLVEVVASRFADAAKKRNIPGNEQSWPHRVLGVSALNSRDFVKAIQSFQLALRTNENDPNSWSGLGEAYADSGRYVAAAKAFSRASELDPANWYPRFQLGMINRQIQNFDEAIEIFKEVLEMRPAEKVVMEHRCEALVAYARDSLERHYYGQAVENALAALEASYTTAKVYPNTFNLWKHAGDAIEIFLTIKSMLPQFPARSMAALFSVDIDKKHMPVLTAVDKIDGVSLTSIFHFDTDDLAQSAAFFHILAYKFALISAYDTARTRAVGWYNIGCAELRAYFSVPSNSGYLNGAIECFKTAITIESRNPQFWNAYGIATSETHSLIAQHAFIRSLIIDHKQVSAWCNLGTLYLIQGDLELANLAFHRAQTYDPDYVISWMGQGLVASAIGEQEEATELLEHSYAISNGRVKLAHWLYAVSEIMLLFPGSNSILLPPAHKEFLVFALEKFLQLEPEYVPAMQYQALVLEQQGDYAYGIEKLTVACDKLEQMYEESESIEALKDFVAAKTQLARLHLAKGDFDTSIEDSRTVIDLTENEDGLQKSRLSAYITAGLAYFQKKDFYNALNMFSIACTETERDADVVVLFAQVLYALGGTNREQAQDELFKNIEASPEHLDSVLLLGTIGLIDNSDDIVEAIITELKDIDTSASKSNNNARSVELLMSALEGHKAGKPSMAPWLESIILQPSDHHLWTRLNQSVALKTAINDEKITVSELSDEYSSTRQFSDAMMAVYISPGNKKAWKSVADTAFGSTNSVVSGVKAMKL